MVPSIKERIIDVARQIPSDIIEEFARNLESAGTRNDDVTHLIEGVRPSTAVLLKNLMEECQTEPELSEAEVASFLRGAAAMDDFWRQSQSLELVWSGPTPVNSGLRRTDQALQALIHAAEKEIIIVTFAAFKVPLITKALIGASERGVGIKLILESVVESGGKIDYDPAAALGESLLAVSQVYVWPLESRPTSPTGHHGSLHVKCAVQDDAALLLSSANLTEFAMELNMEMGMLVKGGTMPGLVTSHFGKLIETGTLRRV